MLAYAIYDRGRGEIEGLRVLRLAAVFTVLQVSQAVGQRSSS